MVIICDISVIIKTEHCRTIKYLLNNFTIMKKMKKFIAFTALLSIAASCTKEDGSISTVDDSSVVEESFIDAELIFDEDAVIDALGIEEDAEISKLEATALRSYYAKNGSKIFTMGNAASGNEIILFNSSSDGTITEAGRFSTEGTGSDTGLVQGALAMSFSGRLLFAVNPGSNDFSFFYVQNNGNLIFLDRIDSGGEMPVSITARGGLIYVLNAGGTGNITGFGVNRSGKLVQLSGSTRALSSSASAPAQVSFSPNGKALVVTERATNTITSFGINRNGRPGSIKTFPSAGVTPFGFSFGNNNVFYVSEATGGAANASTISSYIVNNVGDVKLVDGPLATDGSAACWVTTTTNAKTLFSSNTAGDDISSLSVTSNGKLSLANDGNRTATGDGPVDAAVDMNSKNLYVLAGGTSNSIVSYSIGDNGALKQIDEDGGLPEYVSGMVIR